MSEKIIVNGIGECSKTVIMSPNIKEEGIISKHNSVVLEWI